MIYFVQAGPGGAIKIGYSSSNIKGRVGSLQTGNPYPLKLTRVLKGDLQNEAELHDAFAAFRLCGEWFSPVAELVELAEASLPDNVFGTRPYGYDIHELERAEERGYRRGFEKAERYGIEIALSRIGEAFDSETWRRALKPLEERRQRQLEMRAPEVAR